MLIPACALIDNGFSTARAMHLHTCMRSAPPLVRHWIQMVHSDRPDAPNAIRRTVVALERGRRGGGTMNVAVRRALGTMGTLLDFPDSERAIADSILRWGSWRLRWAYVSVTSKANSPPTVCCGTVHTINVFVSDTKHGDRLRKPLGGIPLEFLDETYPAKTSALFNLKKPAFKSSAASVKLDFYARQHIYICYAQRLWGLLFNWRYINTRIHSFIHSCYSAYMLSPVRLSIRHTGGS